MSAICSIDSDCAYVHFICNLRSNDRLANKLKAVLVSCHNKLTYFFLFSFSFRATDLAVIYQFFFSSIKLR